VTIPTSRASTGAWRRRRLVLAVLAFLAVPIPWASAEGTPCPPRPASRSEAERLARQLYERAQEREAAQPEEALATYRCAQSLVDRPAIALRLGTVAERLGKIEVAIAAFEHYLELAGNDAPDRGEMVRHIESLKSRPREPEGAKARAPETSTPTQPFPTQPAPRATRPFSPWIGAGVIAAGAVAAGVGSVLLVIAKSQSDEVQDLPQGTTWASSEAQGTYDSAQTNQTAGLFALAGGAVAAAVGAVLLVVARPHVDVSASSRGPGGGWSVRF
jgi:tetratricopeptide (TPR) repeat protein